MRTFSAIFSGDRSKNGENHESAGADAMRRVPFDALRLLRAFDG
jgi:hypothetical protein